MTFDGAPWPCGCVIVTDDSPVVINGVHMEHMVGNVVDIKRCAVHQAELKAAAQTIADRIDAMAFEAALRHFGEA
jgi:hypothetical protein